MRKALVFTLVALLCLGAVLAAGCGQENKARTYMEQGDKLSVKMRSLTDDAVFDVVGLLAELGIQLKDTGTVEAGTITDAGIKQVDAVIVDGEKAVKEYEKIMELDGAEEYKEYAEQRVSAIQKTVTVLKAVKKLLAQLGDADNTKSVLDTTTAWAKDNVRVAIDGVRAFTAWRNAEKIKKENNLGPIEEPVKEPAQETAPQSAPEASPE